MNRHVLKHMTRRGRIARLDLMVRKWREADKITTQQAIKMGVRLSRIRMLHKMKGDLNEPVEKETAKV